MKKRKWIAFVLTLALVLSSFTSVMAAGPRSFADMPDDWSAAALKAAVDNGLLTGFAERGGLYIKPGSPLTRAQMASMINKAFNASAQGSLAGVTDVSSGDWFYGHMATAVQMNSFAYAAQMRPNDNITREEAFTVLAKVFKLSEPAALTALNSFNDAADVSSWAAGRTAALIESGYIAGSGGKINPKANITRAEFAAVMNNIVAQYISAPGEYTSVANGNIIVNAAGVTLKNVSVSGDLMAADGIGTGELTLDNVKVSGSLVARGGGSNSIIILGDSQIGNILVDNVNSTVRIRTGESTKIANLDAATNVILEGNFGTVTVVGSGTNVTVNGSVDTIVLADTAAGSKITAAAGAAVGQILTHVPESGFTLDNQTGTDIPVTVDVTTSGTDTPATADTPAATGIVGGGGGGGGGGSSSSGNDDDEEEEPVVTKPITTNPSIEWATGAGITSSSVDADVANGDTVTVTISAANGATLYYLIDKTGNPVEPKDASAMTTHTGLFNVNLSVTDNNAAGEKVVVYAMALADDMTVSKLVTLTITFEKAANYDSSLNITGIECSPAATSTLEAGTDVKLVTFAGISTASGIEIYYTTTGAFTTTEEAKKWTPGAVIEGIGGNKTETTMVIKAVAVSGSSIGGVYTKEITFGAWPAQPAPQIDVTTHAVHYNASVPVSASAVSATSITWTVYDSKGNVILTDTANSSNASFTVTRGATAGPGPATVTIKVVASAVGYSDSEEKAELIFPAPTEVTQPAIIFTDESGNEIRGAVTNGAMVKVSFEAIGASEIWYSTEAAWQDHTTDGGMKWNNTLLEIKANTTKATTVDVHAVAVYADGNVSNVFNVSTVTSRSISFEAMPTLPTPKLMITDTDGDEITESNGVYRTTGASVTVAATVAGDYKIYYTTSSSLNATYETTDGMELYTGEFSVVSTAGVTQVAVYAVSTTAGAVSAQVVAVIEFAPEGGGLSPQNLKMQRLVIEEPAKTEESDTTDDSAETNDPAKTDDLDQTEVSETTDDSVETNDPAKTDNPDQTSNSEKTGNAVQADDSVTTDDPVETEEPVTTDNLAETEEFVTTDNLV